MRHKLKAKAVTRVPIFRIFIQSSLSISQSYLLIISKREKINEARSFPAPGTGPFEGPATVKPPGSAGRRHAFDLLGSLRRPLGIGMESAVHVHEHVNDNVCVDVDVHVDVDGFRRIWLGSGPFEGLCRRILTSYTMILKNVGGDVGRGVQ
jgi:hypothetical protein